MQVWGDRVSFVLSGKVDIYANTTDRFDAVYDTETDGCGIIINNRIEEIKVGR
jgi:hypothetical protein